MNVTFIGMSGAGKSYIGKQFAEQYGLQFVDIDMAMETAYGKPLQEILEALGETTFLQEQAKQVTSLGVLANTVISPGGSVVYTKEATNFLKAQSMVVYLKVPLAVIQARITENSRGIVGLGVKTFADLYMEREGLYSELADYTIDPTQHDASAVLEFIYQAYVLK